MGYSCRVVAPSIHQPINNTIGDSAMSDAVKINGVFVNPVITIWTGKATLKREELPVEADKLPPDDVTKSFGSKAIYDKAKLRPFLAIKSRMRTLMQAKTLPFLGGYMCGEDKLQDVEDGLRKLQQEFQDEVYKLEAEYETVCDEWLQEHRDWENILRPAMPEPHEIGHKFHFGWSVMRVEPVGADTEQEFNTITDKAIEDMAADIAETREKVYLKTNSKNTIKPLERLIERCKALTFMGSPHLGKLADVLEAIKSLPTRHVIAMVLAPLSTPQGLQDFVDSVKQGAGASEILNQAIDDDIIKNSVSISADDADEQEPEPVMPEPAAAVEPEKPEPVIPVAPDNDKDDGDGGDVFLDSFGLF